MAYNPNDKKGAKILRTPAPDEVTSVRAGTKPGLGMNGDTTPVSLAPGKSARSILGQNMLEVSEGPENVLQQVIEGGVAGRDDRIPSDGGNWQQRKIDDTPYPTTFGHRNRSGEK